VCQGPPLERRWYAHEQLGSAKKRRLACLRINNARFNALPNSFSGIMPDKSLDLPY